VRKSKRQRKTDRTGSGDENGGLGGHV
jgi:hypothetical protein